MRSIRTRLRRPSWLSRPVAVIIGLVVGLGGLGGAAGAVLGELGGAGPAARHEMMQPDEGRHHDDRFGRGGNDRDGDDGGGGGVGGPGSGSPR
jgi:hypothetical protein